MTRRCRIPPASPSRRGARFPRALVAAGAAFQLASPAAAHEPPADSIARLTAEVEAGPASAELYLERAELHRTEGHWDAAAADLERALELDPTVAEVDYYRGRLNLDRGRPGEAEAAFGRFLEREPRNVPARALRARARTALGRHAEAIADYDTALGLQPRPSPELYLERARAWADLGQPEAALASLDEGLERLGPVVVLELYAIELEVAQGEIDAALARLEHVAGRARNPAPWLARRAGILEGAGRHDEALETYAEAAAALRALPDARRGTGAMVALERRVRQAIERLMAEGEAS